MLMEIQALYCTIQFGFFSQKANAAEQSREMYQADLITILA